MTLLPDLNPSETQGIDVSHYQGTVEWNQILQAGYRFAFIKATDGITYTDPMFQANWDGAKAAGLLRGAYHFFEPVDDAQFQAQRFLNAVSLGAGDLPPVLDVESTSTSSQVSTTEIIDGVATWLQTVAKATGVTPIIYTNAGFWDGLYTEEFANYPLWVAEYGVNSPKMPTGWTRWTFWQYSETGRISGIQTSVDLDLFQGSLEQLQKMTISD